MFTMNTSGAPRGAACDVGLLELFILLEIKSRTKNRLSAPHRKLSVTLGTWHVNVQAIPIVRCPRSHAANILHAHVVVAFLAGQVATNILYCREPSASLLSKEGGRSRIVGGTT
jgi:hypothetical protein